MAKSFIDLVLDSPTTRLGIPVTTENPSLKSQRSPPDQGHLLAYSTWRRQRVCAPHRLQGNCNSDTTHFKALQVRIEAAMA